jgi:hypothetical protein
MRLTELSVFRNDRSNCRDAALTPLGLSGVASHAAKTRAAGFLMKSVLV